MVSLGFDVRGKDTKLTENNLMVTHKYGVKCQSFVQFKSDLTNQIA